MLLVLALLGCSSEPPPPPPEPEPAPCTLEADSLAGKRFVRETRSADATKDVPDLWTRAEFFEDGKKLKLRYNSRSPFDMYTYTCKKGKGETVCLADNPDLAQWCQTLIANKGSCSAAELADLTGAPIAEATKAAEEMNGKVAKLNPDELANMKRAFSQPNNQLRGMFKFKLNKKACKLNAVDTYQTMVDGNLREVENYVGNSAFIEPTQELTYDHCADVKSLVALTAPGAAATPGQTKVQWKVGETVPFAWAGEGTQAKDGCTYSMDLYDEFVQVEKGKEVPATDGKLAWTFERSYQERGKKIVQLTRYETCGGETKKLEVGCAMVDIQE
jgi:hypothetical protein